MLRPPPPRSTRPDTRFPYTTHVLSAAPLGGALDGRRLGLVHLGLPALADQLLNRGHGCPLPDGSKACACESGAIARPGAPRGGSHGGAHDRQDRLRAPLCGTHPGDAAALVEAAVADDDGIADFESPAQAVATPSARTPVCPHTGPHRTQPR